MGCLFLFIYICCFGCFCDNVLFVVSFTCMCLVLFVSVFCVRFALNLCMVVFLFCLVLLFKPKYMCVSFVCFLCVLLFCVPRDVVFVVFVSMFWFGFFPLCFI